MYLLVTMNRINDTNTLSFLIYKFLLNDLNLILKMNFAFSINITRLLFVLNNKNSKRVIRGYTNLYFHYHNYRNGT